jgi:hypothetical protein
MSYVYHSPEYFRTKLYQKEREFKKFETLSLDDVAKIAKKLYSKQEMNAQSGFFRKDKLTKYMDTLTYLTNPSIHMELKTYDERIIYLIMSVDPELESFKEFLKTNITPTKVINAEQDPKKQQELISQRESEILEMQTRIRNKIGFYDSKLLKYEETYFKRFISSKELITKVNQDNITKLLRIIPLISSFNDISDERYQILQEKAKEWLATTNCENDLFTAAYSCSEQKETIGLNSIIEELIFLVLIGDPELDVLRIYEEESRMDEVERRCKEAFNYYSKDLITLERLYHERFCPEKTLSPWTHM